MLWNAENYSGFLLMRNLRCAAKPCQAFFMIHKYRNFCSYDRIGRENI